MQGHRGTQDEGRVVALRYIGYQREVFIRQSLRCQKTKDDLILKSMIWQGNSKFN